MLVVFASEVPCLLGKDRFHDKQVTLHNIFTRTNEPRAFQKMMLAPMSDDTDEIKINLIEQNPKNILTRVFTRELTPTITISGKLTLCEDQIIVVTKNRKKQLHFGPFENEEYQLQTYLWILNAKRGVVKFVEYHGNEQHITFIYPNDTFKEALLQIQRELLEHKLKLQTTPMLTTCNSAKTTSTITLAPVH
jgi:hypothetical protein